MAEHNSLLQSNDEAARLMESLSNQLTTSYGTASRGVRHQQTTTPDGTEQDAQSSQQSPLIDHNEDEQDQVQTSPSTQDNSDSEDIAPLTRRLRCLFSAITWPIVPLGTIVSIALMWVLYAGFVIDSTRTCSHPLHWYAAASLALAIYAPNHALARSYLFRYTRERDGPVRPHFVKMHDQIFHTICLLYVYSGASLLQACYDSQAHQSNIVLGDNSKGDGISLAGPINMCDATCPNLYQALSIYVTTLEIFTFALLFPLLFLPCIYLWLLRRATEDMDGFARFQEEMEQGGVLLPGEGVTAKELMDSLEHVQFVSKLEKQEDGVFHEQLVLLPVLSSSLNSTIPLRSNVKECCICMTEFEICEDDVEGGLFSRHSNHSNTSSLQQQDDVIDEEHQREHQNEIIACVPSARSDETAIVRTHCGHVFHRRCLAEWIGDKRDADQRDRGENVQRWKARRTCCPLCREDLKPPT